MGEAASFVDLGKQAALEGRKEYEKRRKVQGWAAVKLDVRVICKVDNVEFAPPLEIVINGVKQTAEMNEQTGEKNEGEAKPRNEATIWVKVPVRRKGPDPIQVILRPIDGADEHFIRGQSKKMRYEEAYLRNDVEAHGVKFEVPPKKVEEFKFASHVVRIRVKAKRNHLGGKRKAEHIPGWRKNEADAQS